MWHAEKKEIFVVRQWAAEEDLPSFLKTRTTVYQIVSSKMKMIVSHEDESISLG